MAEHVAEAVGTVAAMLRHSRVAERWHEESACEGMTVGGLAFHLAAQTSHIVDALGAPPRGDEPIAVLEHYRRASWAHSGLDEEPNTSVRDDADARADAGPEALAEKVQTDLAALPTALAQTLDGERQPDTVHIPWQGWSLSTEDFLVTRLMEMLVHTDDLAASIGEEPPDFAEPVVAAVVGLLSAVAVDRHGQTALIRALSRPQRAPSSVSAF